MFDSGSESGTCHNNEAMSPDPINLQINTGADKDPSDIGDKQIGILDMPSALNDSVNNSVILSRG